MENILIEAKALQAELVAHRRWLHAHAEVAFDLTQTKAYVREQLIQMGYEPVECGKAGLIVLAGGKKAGKTFLKSGSFQMRILFKKCQRHIARFIDVNVYLYSIACGSACQQFQIAETHLPTRR